MNWIKKMGLLFCCFCFLKITNAQINVSFLQYLYENNLKKELQTYLWKNTLKENDTLFFERAIFGLNENNEKIFIENFNQAKNLFFQNECALNKAALFNFDKKNEWFERLDTVNLFETTKKILLTYKIVNSKNILTIDSLPNELLTSYSEMQKYRKKKSLNAVLLSLILPGLGEIYAGRKRAFFPVLLSNGFYIAQSIESISKFEVNNGLSILNLSLTGLFYVSNIYGTYYDLKKIKREKQKQFEIDTINYFGSTCQCSVH